MDHILTTEHLVKNYTGHCALQDVSIDVPRGSVYGLLGPNGAGKTTLIRIINHITIPDSGIVTFNGHRLESNDVYNIGYLPEERGLYKKMKVGEQAMFFARLKGLDKKEAEKRLKEWFERLEITDWWDKKVEELSKGMAQKVQFIITVLHKPELLIFDEPFSGFDPINANILTREILRLRDEGATIIFSTHNMESVEELCDEITLINNSRNILSGSVDEIRNRYAQHRWKVMYRGSSDSLAGALENYASVEILPEDASGITTAILEFKEHDALRPALNIINNSVEIEEFNKIIPSMHDIFVRAVTESEFTFKPN